MWMETLLPPGRTDPGLRRGKSAARADDEGLPPCLTAGTCDEVGGREAERCTDLVRRLKAA